jgi:hypothetical protein
MKVRALMSLLVGSGLVLSGCSGDDPVTPTDIDLGPQLVGAPGVAVTFAADLGGLGPGIPVNAGECLKVTGDGKTHFNHCIFLGPVAGDLENPAPDAVTFVLTGVQDAQGNGNGQGSFILKDVTWHSPTGDLTGTFEGSGQIKGTFGLQAGKLHGHGTGGDFKGLQLWGDVQEQGAPPGASVITVTGRIR